MKSHPWHPASSFAVFLTKASRCDRPPRCGVRLVDELASDDVRVASEKDNQLSAFARDMGAAVVSQGRSSVSRPTQPRSRIISTIYM